MRTSSIVRLTRFSDTVLAMGKILRFEVHVLHLGDIRCPDPCYRGSERVPTHVVQVLSQPPPERRMLISPETRIDSLDGNSLVILRSNSIVRYLAQVRELLQTR